MESYTPKISAKLEKDPSPSEIDLQLRWVDGREKDERWVKRYLFRRITGEKTPVNCRLASRLHVEDAESSRFKDIGSLAVSARGSLLIASALSISASASH